MPCLAAPSAGPPKAGWPVRLRHGVLWVVSRLRALGLRNPVGRFDSCTTYSYGQALGGDRGFEPRSSWPDTSTGCSKMPAMPDRPGTAFVTRTKWVRVPPPALEL